MKSQINLKPLSSYFKVVAVVDAPSDRSDLNGGFRNSAEHNHDIKKLVEFLKSDNPNLPVWLIGTSNGSLTAAGAAVALHESPVEALTKAFPNAKKVELISVQGGSDNNDPCNGGYHQFLGQEQEVTDMIAQWILTEPR